MSRYSKAPSNYQKMNIDRTLIDTLKEILAEGEKCVFSDQEEFEKVRLIGDNEASQLRIHISNGSVPRFVISVVCLGNQRQGTMTKIFKAVSQFYRSNGIQIIEIQSAITEGMKQWCRENSFSFNNDGCWLYNLNQTAT